MKVSYAITVCNEKKEVKSLLDYLLRKKDRDDEIVVLFDSKGGDQDTQTMLRKFNKLDGITLYEDEFDGHFGNWKNKLTDHCTGDFIFQIDADEMPPDVLIKNIHYILENNPDAEMYKVSRINTVKGITTQHMMKWGWRVNDKGWINFPDYQMRIYKKSPEIRWVNKVHEVLTGYKLFAMLPANGDYSLRHPKTIDKQEKQNAFYETLQ